jgi:hypothetical protein
MVDMLAILLARAKDRGQIDGVIPYLVYCNIRFLQTIKFCQISSALGCILNKWYKVKSFIN